MRAFLESVLSILYARHSIVSEKSELNPLIHWTVLFGGEYSCQCNMGVDVGPASDSPPLSDMSRSRRKNSRFEIEITHPTES